MGKQIIRLTESDLHQMVKEAVNKILKENMEGEGFGKWIRAGVDAASKKQRTNPQLQPYKGGKFGDSIGNWWSRTKQNAQFEDDMNYVNDPSNFRQNVNYADMNPDSDGDYNYQAAKQRMRQHMGRLAGRGTGYNTIRTDDGRVKNFTTPSDDNYKYRNGKWRREEKDEF